MLHRIFREDHGHGGAARVTGKHRYEETTRDIRIAVEPDFLDEQSEPTEHRYLWSYRVTIENRGAETVQLLTRYWRITDSRGRVREVRGNGVIGEQPVIKPGEKYEYSSGAPLETPSGFMGGSYRMKTGAGETFDVGIPTFALESPYEARRVH
jgi:ApaG protein